MINVLILSLCSFHPVLTDSIGVETINGKMFVIHKVDEKETLFGISRRYRTTVDAILEFNAGAKDGLDIGEILKVPYTPKTIVRPSDGIVHKVVPKETLFSISRNYGVGMADLREWNKLSSDALSVGQELIIRKKGAATTPPVRNPVITKKGVHTVAEKETLFSIARQYNITEKQLREWNNMQGSELKIGQTLYVSQPEQGIGPVTKKQDTVTQKNNSTVAQKDLVIQPIKQTDPVKQETTQQVQTPIKISESIKNGSEVLESGIAELIEGTEGNRKYLALHRTAPLGTILKVRNEMNNREVFVRVMGKLPDTALTEKLIIKISKSAYDRLGAIDQRFRVEVTYYK
jgi:LysM repeat protein